MSVDVPCFPPRSYRNARPYSTFKVADPSKVLRVAELVGGGGPQASFTDVAVPDLDTLKVCLIVSNKPSSNLIILTLVHSL